MTGLRKGWLVVLGTLLTGLVALAQNVRSNGATLVVNEVPVLSFRTGHAGFSPSERAALLARNLEAVGQVNDIRVGKSGDAYQVFINDAPLITATPAEAKACKSLPIDLASSWARKLRDAIDLPAIQLSNRNLKMPVGSLRRVKVIGSGVATAQVQVDHPEVVQAKLVGGNVEVRSVGAGNALVTVNGGEGFSTVDVDVRPFAAVLPQSVSASVVGVPTLASTVEGAVTNALRHGLVGAPNATFSFKMPKVEQLEIGSTRSYQVKVEATAPNAYPRTGYVNLVVRNLPTGKEKDAELWYDNDPESVKFPQNLFAARLQKNRAARMLYHHMNAATAAMFMRVQMINDSDQPAKVMLMPGDANPNQNPVLAGMQAADMYVKAWMYGSGEVVTIPAHTTIPISLHRVGPNETMSGLASFRLMEGPSDVLVRTDAYAPFPVSGVWADAMTSPTPWRETGANAVNDYDGSAFQISPHIYPDPQKPDQTFIYKVGGRHQFLRIGEHAISRQDNSGVLDGNFGVFYQFTASLINPTDKETFVDLQYISSAGYSCALFILDGQLVKSPMLLPQAPWLLKRVKLEPGQEQTIRLTTIPMSGGAYPTTLQIGATGQITASMR